MKRLLIALFVLFLSIGNVYAVEGEETPSFVPENVVEEQKQETTPTEEKKEETKEETKTEEKKEESNSSSNTDNNTTTETNKKTNTNTNTNSDTSTKKNNNSSTNTKTNTNTTTKTTTETVKEEENNIETVEEKQVFNFLKEIKSEMVMVNLTEGVYEYTVSVSEETTLLDLEAVTIDDTYYASISDQNIDPNSDENKITINVSNSTGEKQTYTIKVDIIRSYDAKLDSTSFKKDNSSKIVWGLLLAFFVFLSGVLTILYFYTKNVRKK